MEPTTGKAKYYTLMEALKEQILSGTIKPGQKLPSENELTREYALSRHTVRKALALLENEGYITARHGKGTFCSERVIQLDGPVYLRFGRLAVPVINDNDDYKFEIGKGVVLREGKDVTIVATGLCVSSALEAADMLAEDGIEAKVINIHTIKPIDSDLLVEAAKETGKVVTVEEHSVIGGLGGAVCKVLSEKYPVPVKRIGVNDVYGESGPAVKLIEKYGLDGKGVYASVKEFVK